MGSIFSAHRSDCRESGKLLEARLIGLLFLVYLVVFLNQHFTRFTTWFPLGALFLWMALTRHRTRSDPIFRDVIGGARSGWLAASVLLLSLMTSSLLSPLPWIAMAELLSEIAGPFLLVLVCVGFVRKAGVGRHFLRVMIYGGVLIALTDLAHYARELLTAGALPTDPTHRWFSDGYIFYLPFLLLYRDQQRGTAKHIFGASFFAIFLLISGTGGRATLGAIAVELLLLGLLTRSWQYAWDFVSFLSAVTLGLMIWPEPIGMGAIARGVSDNHRWAGHWRPALIMIGESLRALFLGHGYGREIWDQFHQACVACAYSGPPLGGPHNALLRVLFAGGIPALLASIWLFVTILVSLWRDQNVCDGDHALLARGGLVASIGFYLVAGLVGDPRPEPLAVALALRYAGGHCPLKRRTVMAE